MADLFLDNLQEAAFEGVVFPVAESHTEGGHDSVEHVAYRRRGADVEPTGQQAYRGTLVVPLVNGLTHYGDLFPGRYLELIHVFETTPIGELKHPSKGTFEAHVKAWPEALTSHVRSGVVLQVHWLEHSGSVASSEIFTGATQLDPASSAQLQAVEADAAMAAVSPAVPFVSLTSPFAIALGFLDLADRTYAEITATVQGLLASINANLALPGFASPSAHDAVVALEALRATTFALLDQYLATQGRPRLYTVPRTTSVVQLAQTLYGDASKATLLMAANAIGDPLYVPAGTVLTVLPAS